MPVNIDVAKVKNGTNKKILHGSYCTMKRINKMEKSYCVKYFVLKGITKLTVYAITKNRIIERKPINERLGLKLTNWN